MNRKVTLLGLIVYFALLVSTSHAGWLIYYKPEFKGKIIDAETKEPIEGVVVAVYYTKDTMTLGDGGKSSVIHTREAVTDHNGEFVIPSYTTLIHPFSLEYQAGFIIYKPGYTSRLYKSPENFFSGKMAGIIEEYFQGGEKVKITYGILEMRKLETREKRIRAIPSIPYSSQCGTKEFPKLFKLMNEENKRFGLGVEKW